MARREESLLRFDAVRVEGAIIQPDLIVTIANGKAEGQSEENYGLVRGLNLRDEIGRAFIIAKGQWQSYQDGIGGSNPGAVRRRFASGIMTHVLGFELGAKHGYSARSRAHADIDLYLLDGGRVPVAIGAGDDVDHVETLDIAGADPIRRSATTLIQGDLNARDGALWGIATNGLAWRLLRDNESITRPGYIEIDLARIFRDDLYSDFTAFWLLAHRSRFPQDKAAGSDCALERWRQLGRQQGVTARTELREGVQKALFHFGRGFLENPANAVLVARLNADGDARLTKEDLFRQLLRMVYRLIFVMTAEDRDILHPADAPDATKAAYDGGYATGRLRERARDRIAWDRHHDAFEGIKALFRALRHGEPRLGLPALGGLFAVEQTPDVDGARLTNKRFLQGFYSLAWLRRDKALSRINWRDMETEEFGSVYESLLELTPEITDGGRRFSFAGQRDEDNLAIGENVQVQAGTTGNERKSTGSYYTPDALVQLLLKEALDPIIDRTLAENPENPDSILQINIIDPACGSGHFILGAGRHLASKLAEARHNGPPTFIQSKQALRDVARHCLHGVDLNPMAVELCKVALWIETVEPGKPLTFLDSKIRCGNALIGVSQLSLLAKGIPDEAYSAQEGDDPKAANQYRKINRNQKGDADAKNGQDRMAFAGPPTDLLEAVKKVNELSEDNVFEVEEKSREFRDLKTSSGWIQRKTACDLWTAAFFVRKADIPESQGLFEVPLTDHVWLAWSGSSMREQLLQAAEDVAKAHRFFHWPLEFAEIFERGGFDAVIGNPPWDTMSPDSKEFFSPYEPSIRFMSPSNQKVCVEGLKQNPDVSKRWNAHCRDLYLSANFMKNSGRYKLFAEGNLGKGDFNIYRMFVELALTFTRRSGRAAQIVPENFYNGANAAAIRGTLFDDMHLETLVGFENTGRVWFDIHTSQKFCLYIVQFLTPRPEFKAAFNINSRQKVSALHEGFPLSIPISLVDEFSPDARAVSEIAHPSEIDVARKIYARFPKFGQGWERSNFRPYARELDMGNDRESFSNVADGIPLFEGRMVASFDYRAKAYVSGRGRAAVWQDLQFGTSDKSIMPQWRVDEDDVPLKNCGRWKEYRVGFCDVASPTNQRALVCTLIPPGVICGHMVPTIVLEDNNPLSLLLWIAVANSLSMDFIARKKVSLHMTFSLMDSLPIPKSYSGTAFEVEIVRRCLRLCGAGQEMQPFFDEVAPQILGPNEGPVEHKGARETLRTEIDVIVARDIFGITKNEMRYILDPDLVLGPECGIETFGALKRADIREFGEYRTAIRILEAWDLHYERKQAA